jgi:hypothetical protein
MLHHPRSVALHKVEPEAVEIKLLDGQARVLKHRLVHARIAMTQVRKSRKLLALNPRPFIPGSDGKSSSRVEPFRSLE